MKPILTILCLVILAFTSSGCASTREDTCDHQASEEHLKWAKYQRIQWNACPTMADGVEPYYPRYEMVRDVRARAFRQKAGPHDWWRGVE